MIHYSLHCANGHDFEGWFQSSTAFESQAERGLLSCPRCGVTEVDRGLMAPAVRTRTARPAPQAEREGHAAASVAPASGQLAALPDEMRAVLQKLRAEIERHCDDVGDGFADEALRISRGEAEARGIYGQTSEAEREMLAEEGIAVLQVPWLKPAES